jgi:hypothetical protein
VVQELCEADRVLKKLAVAVLAKKFPAFYGKQKFTIAFNRSRHWTHPKEADTGPRPHILLLRRSLQYYSLRKVRAYPVSDHAVWCIIREIPSTNIDKVTDDSDMFSSVSPHLFGANSLLINRSHDSLNILICSSFPIIFLKR